MPIFKLLLENGVRIRAQHIFIPIENRDIKTLRVLMEHAESHPAESPINYEHVCAALKIGEDTSEGKMCSMFKL
jgi:hypothetical protein